MVVASPTPTSRSTSGRATEALRLDVGDLSAAEQRDWEAANYSWPYLAGLEWKRLMAAFEVAKAEIGPERWLDLRYEDLVARPADETKPKSLRFAGLAQGRASNIRLAGLQVSEGFGGTPYRDELRPEDVARLEDALAPTLERWGYALESGA